jgi:hypothetical protein
MLMYVIVLSILGFFISIFVPIGGIIIFSITFAVVILNYQKTLKIYEEAHLSRPVTLFLWWRDGREHGR